MKLELSTFVDYNQSNLEEQLAFIQALQLEKVVIRRISGESLLKQTDEVIAEYSDNLAKRKMGVIAIDPLIKSTDINNTQDHQRYIDDLTKALEIAKKFKAEYIFYQIPLFKDVMVDTQMIVALITIHIALIKKNKIQVLIKPADGHHANTYRYLLNVIKDSKVKIIFDAVYHESTKKEADKTVYRLLKDYIGLMVANDIDRLGLPRLIGKGEIEIKDMFKRVIKDTYEGYIVLDSELPTLIARSSKYKWYHTLFSQKKKVESKILYDFQQRSKSFSTLDVIKYQMTILNMIFLNKKVNYK